MRPRLYEPRESVTFAVGLVLAAVLLGWTLQWSNGTFDWHSLGRLALAAAALVLAKAMRPVAAVEARAHWAHWALAAAQLCQLAELFAVEPGGFLELGGAAPLLPFHLGVAVAGACAMACASRRRTGTIAFALLLATSFALGVWIIRHSPKPFIDVHVFQRDAAAELLAGHNPYAMDFPDVYRGHSPYYGEGLSVDGRVRFGLPYPPLGLLLALPGHLVGDHRYSLLAATVATAALIGLARPGPWARLCAATLLLSPRLWYVIEHGWTEPYAGLALAAVVFAALRAPRLLPFAVGALLGVKQYLVLAVPLLILLLPRPRAPTRRLVRHALGALAVVVAPVLPFVLWNPRAFFHSVVLLQARQPFRPDALSLLAAIADLGGPQFPGAVALLAAGAAMWFGLRRAPHSAAGFAASVALVLLAFFAFNKQAFCNYYHLVLVAMCCAAGAVAVPRRI